MGRVGAALLLWSAWSRVGPELGKRLAIAGYDLWFYALKLVWPHPLIFIYPKWQLDPVHPIVFVPLLGALSGLLFFILEAQLCRAAADLFWSRALCRIALSGVGVL